MVKRAAVSLDITGNQQQHSNQANKNSLNTLRNQYPSRGARLGQEAELAENSNMVANLAEVPSSSPMWHG